MDNKFKMFAAILFQFALVGILTWCLYAKIGDADTIIGALIGLAVGIGLGSISE